MELKDLKLNRFGAKDANQQGQTKGAVYTGSNPTPKQIDEWRKLGQGNRSAEEDRGAPNVLTGTVITSCFIQTSALPSRVELAGNDITFFDDTTERNGSVVGDTSRIVWTYASARDLDGEVTSGFIMEKRASIHDTYDNVFSFYALEPITGRMNYMYFGMDGRRAESNTNYIQFNVDYDPTATTQTSANGSFIVSRSDSGVLGDIGIAFFNEATAGGDPLNWSVFLSGRGPDGSINVNSNIYPNQAGLDIGAPSAKFGTFYGSVSACPLPTVDNALDLLSQIPEPALVGERGHYGLDRKYFDDLTMPQELLYTDPKGRTDIEHNHMLGFLLKVVKELKAEIDELKSNRYN